MIFESRLSTAPDLDTIIDDLTGQLPEQTWDLAIMFLSMFSKESSQEIIGAFKQKVHCRHYFGCSAQGVIATAAEAERIPGVSVLLIQFGNVTLRPFYFDQSQISAFENPNDLYSTLNIFPNENPKFIILPDPFSVDINHLLDIFNQAFGLCPVLGGLASAGTQASENLLFLDNNFYDEGCIGLSLQGQLRVETIVSQGCRPIAETYVVTRSEGNIILDLGGRPFYEVLESVIKNASDQDRISAQTAIFVGIAINEYQHEFKTGDFLIRMLVGLDQSSGAGAITDFIHPGQTIQFHVRDAISAQEELNDLLSTQVLRHPKERPQGAIVFSCNGRGHGLFGVPNHDLNLIKKYFGPIPLTGFFCAGEIGPIGGKNFIHGFTSSIALFYP